MQDLAHVLPKRSVKPTPGTMFLYTTYAGADVHARREKSDGAYDEQRAAERTLIVETQC